MASTTRIAVLGITAATMIALVWGAAPDLEMRSVADRVFLRFDDIRREKGLPEWTRMPGLDDLAAEAAERAGKDPWGDVGGDIHRSLEESRIINFRRIVPLVQTLRGYDDRVQTAFDQWKAYSGAWNSLMDPTLEAIGIADTVDSDGTTVVVAILVEHLVPPGDLLKLERDVEEAINQIRAERGREPLLASERLADVARSHSRDMANRAYFAHESPEGFEVAERALQAGIVFHTVAENILETRGPDDPGDEAVRQWMRSRGHRRNILDEVFTETGVGVAVDETGKLFFTQVFVDPVGKGHKTTKQQDDRK